MGTIILVVLALVVLITISIAQVYRAVPLIELKRRARRGDKLSKALYKVSVYSYSSQFLLWFIASICSASFFVLVSRSSPVWLAVVSSLILIWVAYIWVPRSSINIISQFLASELSSPLGWVLLYLGSPIQGLHRLLSGGKPKTHTGIYEKADVISLIKKQSKQTDSRIDPVELDMIERVMSFNDKKVSDVMTPKRKVTSVEVGDSLGPIVLTELHKSGQEYFPVYDRKPGDIVGLIDIKNIANVGETKKAKQAMSEVVSYAHEDERLVELLKSMTKTHQQLFVIVNDHEDYIGVVTSKNILSELIGSDIAEDFDRRENREAVAKRFDKVDNVPTEEVKDEAELIE